MNELSQLGLPDHIVDSLYDANIHSYSDLFVHITNSKSLQSTKLGPYKILTILFALYNAHKVSVEFFNEYYTAIDKATERHVCNHDRGRWHRECVRCHRVLGKDFFVLTKKKLSAVCNECLLPQIETIHFKHWETNHACPRCKHAPLAYVAINGIDRLICTNCLAGLVRNNIKGRKAKMNEQQIR